MQLCLSASDGLDNSFKVTPNHKTQSKRTDGDICSFSVWLEICYKINYNGNTCY